MSILAALSLPAATATLQNADWALDVTHRDQSLIKLQLRSRATEDTARVLPLEVRMTPHEQPALVAPERTDALQCAIDVLITLSSLRHVLCPLDAHSLREVLVDLGGELDLQWIDADAEWCSYRLSDRRTNADERARDLLATCHRQLGITDCTLPPQPEARVLVAIGADCFGRPQRLTPGAAEAWHAMHAAAKQTVPLALVSAYRGIRYQHGLLERKRAAGTPLGDILAVNAPPGYSEHHTGRAVDVAAPEQEPLVEAFEGTPQFRWLQAHAADYGFHLSYPRDNSWGLLYEPWHWCYRGDAQ